MNDPGIIVASLDPETGEELDRKTVRDDWCLVCHGQRYLDGIQRYGNGTVVLTIKLRAPGETKP